MQTINRSTRKSICVDATRSIALMLGMIIVIPLARAKDSNITPASSHPQPSSAAPGVPPESLGISFVDGSTTTMVLEREGKKYLVDLVTRTVSPAELTGVFVRVSDNNKKTSLAWGSEKKTGATIYKNNCEKSQGIDGKGVAG